MNDWNIEDNKISNYLKSCLESSENDDKFNNFKRDYRYTPILEHVSHSESLQYINEIGLNNLRELVSDKLEIIKENDIYGNPVIYEYYFLGKISPTTIRYIKNVYDIVSNFNISEIKNIVEIGGGYGGLCKTMHSIIGFDKYSIFDLKEPNLLTNKYLKKFDINFETMCLDHNFNGDIDLLISNYAFSEVPYDIQLEYIEKVISKSKNFYMIYNTISEESSDNRGMTHYEFCKTMSNFNIKIENEHGKNKILYGKKIK